jgi:hypothetical protein
MFPFAQLALPVRQRLFVLALIATVGVGIWVSVLGRPLATGGVPGGIVDFELAGNAVAAQRMIDSWGPAGVAAAMAQTQADFVYIVVYSLFFALGAGLSIGPWAKRGRFWQWLGIALSWGAFVAGGLDVIENIAMLDQWASGATDSRAALARNTAIPKFGILIVSLLYQIMAFGLCYTDKFIALVREIWRKYTADNTQN